MAVDSGPVTLGELLWTLRSYESAAKQNAAQADRLEAQGDTASAMWFRMQPGNFQVNHDRQPDLGRLEAICRARLGLELSSAAVSRIHGELVLSGECGDAATVNSLPIPAAVEAYEALCGTATKRGSGGGEKAATTVKRGRPAHQFTKQRADFAKPLRDKGMTWGEILDGYKRKHRGDREANADNLRLAHDRKYPIEPTKTDKKKR